MPNKLTVLDKKDVSPLKRRIYPVLKASARCCKIKESIGALSFQNDRIRNL